MLRPSATTLKGKALQLLALRDYSRAEMHEKLLRWLRTQATKQTSKQARSTGAGASSRRAAASATPAGAARGNTAVRALQAHSEHDESFDAWTNDTPLASDACLAVHDEATHETSPHPAHEAAAWLEEQSRLIPAVLDEMQAKGWLDDRRAAEALLHQRSARFGQIRLRQVLQQKGIDANTCQELLQEAAQSEHARAQALWQKKFGALPNTPTERAKQMRFLASRGFAAATIQRLLRYGPEDEGM